MFGVGALLAVVLWLTLVVSLARRVGRRVKGVWRRRILVTCLVAAVFIAPVIDDLLGGWQFDALCEKTLEDSVLGYVEVGPGAFFDAGGEEIWRKRQPRYFNSLLSDEPFKSEFASYVEYRSSGRTISGHAIPIHEERSST
jgi:hypothetical protein